MIQDTVEYHTVSTTPLSPLPFHPSEPANIPVLQNQTDPVFNMTSTHFNSIPHSTSPIPTTTIGNGIPEHIGPITTDSADVNDDASFSDPYDEQEKAVEDSAAKKAMESTEIDDDYAMTFDSEGEDKSSRQDVSNASFDQEMQSQSAPVSVAATDIHASTAPDSVPISVAPDGANNPTSHNPFSPAAATAEDVPVAIESSAAPVTNETVLSHSQSTYEDVSSNGGIDIQQLLDNITATAALNAPNAANATPTSAISSSPNFLPPGSLGLPAHASLPPRPQITQKPPMHPAYASQDDIRKYHAGPPGFPPPQLSSYRPPGVPASIVAAGAPGTSTDPRNTLPPPPSASFQPTPSIATPPSLNHISYPQNHRLPVQDRPANSIEIADADDDAEISWSPAVQKMYDEFLADERMYVSEGLWDRFPAGSRLFIGNLPTEKVTKRDLFYTFFKYGRLAQVSIKQAYGFVQFHDVASCHTALEREQGQEIRGRKMHLEISKPQKNTRSSASSASVAHISTGRSRSPDYVRGATDRGVRSTHASARGGGYDRYDSHSAVSPRENEFRGSLRGRDDYRPGRSPSPPRGNYRGRDEYGPSRGRDYYDGRDRRRSRSRSPYGRRDSGRYRERSLTPRVRDSDDDGDLQMPRRDPRDIPDVQIVLMDELDRGFVGWVEGELRARGIKTEVMLLSQRVSLAAVIRRQILEGVLAVTQLTRRSQDSGKIPLQVFDRKGGANNVRFDEYQDLEPKIAAELVLRAKQTQVTTQPAYGQPQFMAGQSYQQNAATTNTPNLASLVGQLDNSALQKLLGTLNTAAPPSQSAPSANPTIDLAGILGGLARQQPPQQGLYQSLSQPPNNAYATLNNNENLASLLGNAITAQAQPQQQSAQQVQNIMAQLAKFRQ